MLKASEQQTPNAVWPVLRGQRILNYIGVHWRDNLRSYQNPFNKYQAFSQKVLATCPCSIWESKKERWRAGAINREREQEQERETDREQEGIRDEKDESAKEQPCIFHCQASDSFTTGTGARIPAPTGWSHRTPRGRTGASSRTTSKRDPRTTPCA